ncbi:MAG: TonB-dependent receptor [Halieaceae bacterium]|nr:TonB-dependent receptor [Halieaceae bacterium]
MTNTRTPPHWSRARRQLSALLISALTVTIFQSPTTLAQGATVLEEVLVVARKREENLQASPVAVSAFSGDQMRAALINNISDLTQHVPGLSNRDGRKGSALSIRGVGARVAGARTDPGVGVYVDGVYLPRLDTQLIDVVAMESIQVLRGPQGTLFGKNTAGGAMLLSSRKPAQEFMADVKLGLGEYDRRNLSGRIEGPLITDTLYGALTYDYRKEDGFMEDFYTGADYGDVDRKAVVGQLRWQPGEDLTVDLFALWGEKREHSGPRTCMIIRPGARLQSFRTTTPGVFSEACALSESLVKQDKVTMDATVADSEWTNTLVGLTLDWQVGAVTLKSVTGYLQQEDLKGEGDNDGTPLFSIGNSGETIRQLEGSGIDADNQQREFISQEFNLTGSLFDDKLEYTLGIFGSDETIDDNPGGQILSLGGWLGFPVAGSTDITTLPPSRFGAANSNLYSFSGTSAAAFGQLIYNFSDMWQFTVGGRWTREEKEIEQDNFLSSQGSIGRITREEMNELRDFLQPFSVNQSNPTLRDDDSWTEFTPTATVTLFAPDSWTEGVLDAGMFYLTYSEGFKAGGFSQFGPDNPLTFDPETVQNTEFGFKVDMWDRRLRVNGALYSMEYDDMQIGVSRQVSDTQARFGTTNAGSADLQGLELEVSMLPLEGLLIHLTGSYIDTEFTEFFDEFVDRSGTTQITDRSHEPFSYLPDQTYSWAVQYDWHTDWALITPRISGYYKDEVYIGLEPTAFLFEESTLDDYVVWNARLAVQPRRLENLEIALFAQNLTDEFFYGTGTVEARNMGTLNLIRGKPRTYGVDVLYRF